MRCSVATGPEAMTSGETAQSILGEVPTALFANLGSLPPGAIALLFYIREVGYGVLGMNDMEPRGPSYIFTPKKKGKTPVGIIPARVAITICFPFLTRPENRLKRPVS